MNKMDKEMIESFRNIVKPFVAKRLFELNYEGKGAGDKHYFEKDFDRILDLAIKGLEANDNPAQNITRVAKFSEQIDKGLERDQGNLPNPAIDMSKYTALSMLCLKEMNHSLAYIADVLMGIAKMMPTQEEDNNE